MADLWPPRGGIVPEDDRLYNVYPGVDYIVSLNKKYWDDATGTYKAQDCAMEYTFGYPSGVSSITEVGPSGNQDQAFRVPMVTQNVDQHVVVGLERAGRWIAIKLRSGDGSLITPSSLGATSTTKETPPENDPDGEVYELDVYEFPSGKVPSLRLKNCDTGSWESKGIWDSNYIFKYSEDVFSDIQKAGKDTGLCWDGSYWYLVSVFESENGFNLMVQNVEGMENTAFAPDTNRWYDSESYQGEEGLPDQDPLEMAIFIENMYEVILPRECEAKRDGWSNLSNLANASGEAILYFTYTCDFVETKVKYNIDEYRMEVGWDFSWEPGVGDRAYIPFNDPPYGLAWMYATDKGGNFYYAVADFYIRDFDGNILTQKNLYNDPNSKHYRPYFDIEGYYEKNLDFTLHNRIGLKFEVISSPGAPIGTDRVAYRPNVSTNPIIIYYMADENWYWDNPIHEFLNYAKITITPLSGALLK